MRRGRGTHTFPGFVETADAIVPYLRIRTPAGEIDAPVRVRKPVSGWMPHAERAGERYVYALPGGGWIAR